MPEQEAAPITNTAMRIGTSHLVPPPPGPHNMPPVSMARPPHPPAAAVSLQTQLSAPAAVGPASSVDANKTMTPAPASSQGTAPTAATPLVSHAQVQSSATPHGSQQRRTPANGSGEQRACNCKNSRCLKLYCECFASGRYCNACNCSNCMNNKDHEQARSKAIEAILEPVDMFSLVMPGSHVFVGTPNFGLRFVLFVLAVCLYVVVEYDGRTGTMTKTGHFV